ncbi:HypC/HybG/HupF family hydrogenase formation chaperone [Thiosocius teredinicola]|uniref:HypC/HybG/HupF family hydrogenase formation chaperone n=1 Tax=Thiosocius teredinicola TaxID=1973002 RepID=UPI000990EAAA
MCIGIPMQVVDVGEFQAGCDDNGQRHIVDISLVGTPSPGDWLLVFLGAAREILDERTALEMRDAVNAIQHVMSGDHQVDHLFADLIDREPQLPDHLKNNIKEA